MDGWMDGWMDRLLSFAVGSTFRYPAGGGRAIGVACCSLSPLLPLLFLSMVILRADMLFTHHIGFGCFCIFIPSYDIQTHLHGPVLSFSFSAEHPDISAILTE